MATGESYLDAIEAELKKGHRQWKRGDKLLDAFGYTRRRQTVIDLINAELIRRKMRTDPPLTTSMPLDRGITFYLEGHALDSVPFVEPAPPEGEPTEVMELASETEGEPGKLVTIVAEPPTTDPEKPTDRLPIVGNLESADKFPVTISPSEPIAVAMYLLAKHDYSQLVVVSGKATPRGIVSYKSIAKAYLHGSPKTVADCIDASVPSVAQNESLARVVDFFTDHDVVLVTTPDKLLAGIVTLFDLAVEYDKIASPILLIGQIEDELRWLARKLDIRTALKNAGDDPETAPSDVTELTMGDLCRILSNVDNWTQVGIAYDRASFCADLDAVREIRNGVMHFRDLPQEAPETLKRFASLVRDSYTADVKEWTKHQRELT